MPFLHVFPRPPGAPISLLIFKKQFQIGLGRGRIAFDDQNHIASRPQHPPPKLVITLGSIGGQNASLTQDLESTTV